MILRDLRKNVRQIEQESGRTIKIADRVSSEEILSNLAQGLDLKTWCREGLIDELHAEPLCTIAGGQAMDIRPYVELARKYNIRIVGGCNGIYGKLISKAAFLRRAIGLARAGVDGIEIYESEMVLEGSPWRWVVPLAGHPDRAEQYLAESNLEAAFPIDAWSATGGFDNHFIVNRYTLYDVVPRQEKQGGY